MKYKCPCCGYYTFNDNRMEIMISVLYVFGKMTLLNYYAGGANKVSLLQGQKNYKLFAACEKEMIPYIREPKEDEIGEID